MNWCRSAPANIRITKARVWAEPDIAAAARAMASIVDDPVAAEARAGAGQAFIETHHSLAAVGKQMRDRLNALGLLDEEARA